MCYFEGMARPFPTGVGQVTQWLALIWWVAVIVALVWFEVNDPLTWPHVSRFAAIAVGVIGGLLVTRRHWWLALVPLIAFVIGGWLLSTRVLEHPSVRRRRLVGRCDRGRGRHL